LKLARCREGDAVFWGVVDVAAGLVRPKRIKGWTMYKRDERAIAAAKKAIRDQV